MRRLPDDTVEYGSGDPVLVAMPGDGRVWGTVLDRLADRAGAPWYFVRWPDGSASDVHGARIIKQADTGGLGMITHLEDPE